MPTVTDDDPRRPGWLSRRALLAGATVAAFGGGSLVDANAAASSSSSSPSPFDNRRVRLAAAWDDPQGHRVGVLGAEGGAHSAGGPRLSLSAIACVELPTRAHGLLVEAGAGNNSLLAVARRPGDWLLRWRPTAGVKGATSKGAAAQWVWSEAGRTFNGHVIAGPRSAGGGHGAPSSSPRWMFTTETDLDSGMGLVGVRDARSLVKLHEWPTHGMDPHELLLDERGLWVANGGIPTQPETGRAKVELHRMDPSLVLLEARTGRLLGQWRLPDPRLSLRHLALGEGGRIGIALQAEHDAPGLRLAAPVLAVFDGGNLETVPLPEGPSLQGYGGDIAAHGGGFIVSAPKAGRAAGWQAGSGWQTTLELPHVCALAESPQGALWCAGEGQALLMGPPQAPRSATPWPLAADVRLDNHWVVMRRG
jgi:hypothetical protein